MSPNSLIRFSGASLGRNGCPILIGVDLEIKRGSFIGLVGANGSGKSTLLKTIAGILPILAGRLEFPLGRPRFGYVPQHDTLDSAFPISALEAALMGAYGRLDPFSFEKRALRARTLKALEDVRAGDLAGRPFAELSGGERQRVLIARALATDPDCLVLDEPVAGIDHATVEVIMDLMSALHQRQALTVLMVSHHLLSLRARADEIVWISDRRLIGGPASAMLSAEKIEEMLAAGGG
jgi:ABC-type Mn2+/Zn2+ transport system ATPase subunit